MSKREKRKSQRERSTDDVLDDDEWLIELWGAHQVFMNLGFLPDDLFVGFEHLHNVGTDCLYVSLRTQGKEFIYTIGRLPGRDEMEVFERWQAFIAEMQTKSPELLDAIGRQSTVGGDINALFALTATLAKRGFQMPNLPEVNAEVGEIFGHDVPPVKPVGQA